MADEALFLLNPQLKDGRFEVIRAYERPSTALGNGNQLQQIAVNLLVNAFQAMGERGQVTIATGAAGPGRVKLSVTDTGPGVRPEIAKRIFEPFFTTKAKGSGLGLSIVHAIVTQHGGRMRVEDSPEGGARFIVSLPRAR